MIREFARDEDGRVDEEKVANQLRIVKNLEKIINAINLENLHHTWITSNESARVYHPNPELVQMHIEEPFRGTRLYTADVCGAQNSIADECRAVQT